MRGVFAHFDQKSQFPVDKRVMDRRPSGWRVPKERGNRYSVRAESGIPAPEVGVPEHHGRDMRQDLVGQDRSPPALSSFDNIVQSPGVVGDHRVDQEHECARDEHELIPPPAAEGPDRAHCSSLGRDNVPWVRASIPARAAGARSGRISAGPGTQSPSDDARIASRDDGRGPDAAQGPARVRGTGLRAKTIHPRKLSHLACRATLSLIDARHDRALRVPPRGHA